MRKGKQLIGSDGQDSRRDGLPSVAKYAGLTVTVLSAGILGKGLAPLPRTLNAYALLLSLIAIWLQNLKTLKTA